MTLTERDRKLLPLLGVGLAIFGVRFLLLRSDDAVAVPTTAAPVALHIWAAPVILTSLRLSPPTVTKLRCMSPATLLPV